MKVEDRQKKVLDGSMSPMLAQCVSGILRSRQEVEINEFGCYHFMDVVERQYIVTFV